MTVTRSRTGLSASSSSTTYPPIVPSENFTSSPSGPSNSTANISISIHTETIARGWKERLSTFAQTGPNCLPSFRYGESHSSPTSDCRWPRHASLGVQACIRTHDMYPIALEFHLVGMVSVASKTKEGRVVVTETVALARFTNEALITVPSADHEEQTGFTGNWLLVPVAKQIAVIGHCLHSTFLGVVHWRG